MTAQIASSECWFALVPTKMANLRFRDECARKACAAKAELALAAPTDCDRAALRSHS
jgi:hypothetical protein